MTQRGDVTTVPGNPSPSMKTLRALDAGSLRGLLPQRSERTQLDQMGYAPEGGAGSGVLRRRLVTAGLGRPGTPPARHYDLAARSSLHGSARHLPAVVGRRAPKETEARPREPKTATVERREASVPRHGTQGASQAPGVSRHKRVHARL